MKIGVMFGNPETTPGGKALKFYSDQRIKTYAKGKIKVKEGGEETIVGQVSVATFVKNKTARPFGTAEFRIVFDASSLNPVVMLCNSLKAFKLVKTFKGLFNIPKGVIEKDKIETGATTMIELADWLISKDLVLPMIDKLIEAAEEDPTAGDIDGAILEMKENPSKIVSPSAVKMSDKKVEDSKVEDFDSDEIAEVDESDIEEISE